jgi:hypothetical protein
MKFDAKRLVHLPRPRVAAGKMVTAEDLRAEQEYQREMRWQHNRLLHGYGIVVGLEVIIQEKETDGSQVVIAPGYALDGWGRELLVSEPLALALSPDRRDFVVYLRYSEAETADGESVQVLFEPPAERLTAPTARSDFAIPLARFRKPHHQWQHDRTFRAPRAQ